MANKETTRVSAHVDRVLDASVVAAGAGALGSAVVVVVVAGAGAGAAGATVVVVVAAGLGVAAGVATQHVAASPAPHATPAQSVVAAAAIKAPV